jgi:hypothetical protein
VAVTGHVVVAAGDGEEDRTDRDQAGHPHGPTI